MHPTFHSPITIAVPLIAALGTLSVQGKELMVQTVNKSKLARENQTIELSALQLAPLDAPDLTRVHVLDSAGNAVLCQAVDTDFDAYRRPDIVIFQADFAPEQTLSFTLRVGDKHAYTKDQFKAYGRFVRERFDDFCWENDRIAHRTYGKALETWEGEPLSSSTIDIWSKRTPRMVINEWYMTEDYHADHGEGADFYSAGLTRGCGGNGLWADGRLWVSRTFVESRVLANGPIRVMFELVYEPFDVNGISVAEVKRVTLDAGQQLDHFESYYKPYTRPGNSVSLISGVGLKKVSGEQVELNVQHGWLAKWEKMAKNAGNQGLAVIVDPQSYQDQVQDDSNHLVLVTVSDDDVASYWAGFCWDKAGPFSDFAAWADYVDGFAQGLASPIEIEIQVRE